MSTTDRSGRVTVFQALCSRADRQTALRDDSGKPVASASAWSMLLQNRLDAIDRDLLDGEVPHDMILSLAADAFAWVEHLLHEARA